MSDGVSPSPKDGRRAEPARFPSKSATGNNLRKRTLSACFFFVAVKCGRSSSFRAVGRGRSFVDGVAPASTHDEAGHRDGLVATGGGGGDNIKRSRDYRTSSRSNVTTNDASAAAAAAVIQSTSMLRPFTTYPACLILSLLAPPSTCFGLVVLRS